MSKNKGPTRGRAAKRAARGYVKHHGKHALACPFQARIGVLGRRISLGYFGTEQEAAAAHRAGLKLAAELVPEMRAAAAKVRGLQQANGMLERGVRYAQKARAE